MKEKLIKLFEDNGFIKTDTVRHIKGYSWVRSIETTPYFEKADTLSFSDDWFFIAFGDNLLDFGEFSPCISGISSPRITIRGSMSEINNTLLKYIKEKI